MAEQVTFQMIFQFLQTVGILVGVFYYIMTIRSTRKSQQQALETRQAQLFMQIVNQYSQPSLVEAKDLYDKLELNSLEDYEKIWADHEKAKMFRGYWGWIEGIGVLVRENYLDIKVIAGLMSGNIKRGWEKKAPYVLEMREVHSVPQLFIEWENLYNTLMEYGEQHPELGIHETSRAPGSIGSNPPLCHADAPKEGKSSLS
jgi:hypothetical protein